MFSEVVEMMSCSQMNCSRSLWPEKGLVDLSNISHFFVSLVGMISSSLPYRWLFDWALPIVAPDIWRKECPILMNKNLDDMCLTESSADEKKSRRRDVEKEIPLP